MKLNTSKSSHVNGTITFSEEEKETIKKVYLLVARVYGLTNELDNHMDDFTGYLNFKNNDTEELYHLEEIFETLAELSKLESIDFEYYEPQIES